MGAVDGWMDGRWEAAEGSQSSQALLCIKSLGNTRGGVGEVKRENLINVIGASPQRGESKLNSIKSLSHLCSWELCSPTCTSLCVDGASQVLLCVHGYHEMVRGSGHEV